MSDLQQERPSPADTARSAIDATGDIVNLFGEAGFGAVLVAMGTAIALTSMWLRLEFTKEWAAPEFVGLLSFGALQVVLGSVERLVLANSSKTSREGGETP